MSDYKFTGPFYCDGEDYGYEAGNPVEAEFVESYQEPAEETCDSAQIEPAEESAAGNCFDGGSADAAAGNSEPGNSPETGDHPDSGDNPGAGDGPDSGNDPGDGDGPDSGKPPVWDTEAGGDDKPPVDQPKKTGLGKTLLKTACIALVAGLVGGGAFLGLVSAGFKVFGIGKTTPTIAEMNKGNTSQLEAGTIKESIDVSAVAEQCMPSVVSITNKGVQEIRSWFGTYQQEISGSGSGIIIGENSTELLIVTNYHVVADSTQLSVYFSFDEKEEEPTVVSAKIKGYDSQKDLAVIAVQLSEIPDAAKSQISIATIGNSAELRVGEQVVAIGNALGYGQSVTTGIVSALNRDVTVEGANGEVITNKLIQTDAAINPGNSGGALLNMKGEVIGINSVKFASAEVEGMGYAIPITDVEKIIGNLMNKETREKVPTEQAGYLGIECVDVSSEASQMYGMPIGIYVKRVVSESAAEKAGIKEGDVIVKLDGSSVAGNVELREALSYYKAGETVEITVCTRESGYQEQVMEVTLSSAKEAGIK